MILKFKNICDALYQKWLEENVQLISNTRYESALYTAYANIAHGDLTPTATGPIIAHGALFKPGEAQ